MGAFLYYCGLLYLFYCVNIIIIIIIIILLLLLLLFYLVASIK